MAIEYNKTNWVNNVTKLNADNMNHIEDGIVNSVNGINELKHDLDNGNVGNGTITPQKTSFITVVKNLYNYQDTQANSYWSSGATIFSGTGAYAVLTPIILEPNTKYVFSKDLIYIAHTYLRTLTTGMTPISDYMSDDNTYFTTDETHIKLYLTVRINPNETQMLVKNNLPFETVKYNDDTIIAEKLQIGKTLYCGTSREYTKLKDAVAEAIKYSNCTLYVDDGEYDLVSEYGQAYLDTTTTDKGMLLRNGIHIIFSNKAKVTFNYIGTNPFIHTEFSPFNASYKGFTLENLTLECSNCRYPIHDDRGFTVDTYSNSYINCNISIDNSNNPDWTNHQCIGGGFGENGTILIENCVFNDYVTYHNNNSTTSTGCQSKLIIKDSYFKTGGIQIIGYGVSTKKSTAIIDNNSYRVALVYNSDDADNIDVFAWNNEVRNN